MKTIDRATRLRVSDDEFLARFPLQPVSVPELIPEYPEYEKKAIRRRCWWLHNNNQLKLVDCGKGHTRHFFQKVPIGDSGEIDVSGYNLIEQGLMAIVNDLNWRGASSGTALWVIRQLIPGYVEEVALRGVTTAEIRETFALDDKAIAFLDSTQETDLGQEAIDRLVETSIYLPGRRRWYLSLSPLIGFTPIGDPFYKGTGLPPRWIESDGMC